MSDSDKIDSIRASVLGADRAFKAIAGGKAANDWDDDDCPVCALGHSDGHYWFLDFAGQPRKLAARELGNRAQLISLFGGDDIWLRQRFPVRKEVEDETGDKTMRVVDFRVNAVAQEMIARASRRGLWGKATKLRQPGVWRGPDGLPVVHCGDAVLIGPNWEKPGFRTGKQIWVAAEATARPSAPCGPDIARRLQEELQGAWTYRNPEAAIAIIGVLYSGWLCGALDWRLNAFVTGPTGSGKTQLMNTIRACWPEHDYSNDTSKAGMEQTIASRAIPAIIDEAADRNSSAGRDLIDIILSSSGGEGTKLARGTADGKGRSAEVVSTVVMFSIYPPPLQPQHMGRLPLIELEKPDGGADNILLHRRIAEFARAQATALWGRAIAAYERYVEALAMFRAALADADCTPREMDSKGALLSGWFVMLNDGLPTERELKEGVKALGGLLVTAEEAEADDAPQRALQHLQASQILLHRSTDRKPIAELLLIAFDAADADPEMAHSAAADQLARNGIRPVRACIHQNPAPLGEACNCTSCTNKGKQVPREERGAGIWIARSHPSLQAVFRGSDFDNGKWMTALGRCRGAIASQRAIRIGALASKALWLPASLLLPEDDPPLKS